MSFMCWGCDMVWHKSSLTPLWNSFLSIGLWVPKTISRSGYCFLMTSLYWLIKGQSAVMQKEKCSTSSLNSAKARTLFNIFSAAATVGHPEQLMIPIRSRGSSFGYRSKNPLCFLMSPKHTIEAQSVSCVQFEQFKMPMRAILHLLFICL